MSTLDWKTTPAGTLAGVSLSPHDLLVRLHRQRRLVPLLREAVAEEFLLLQVKQAGLTVSDEDLQQAADRFRHRHGLTGAEQTRQWLAREGRSVEDFEATLERDLLVAKFKQHLTQPRVAEHFAAHQGCYARAQLRQIVVASEELARELLAQITDEGRDFAELARAHSLHGSSRQAGGSLGRVPRYALPAAAAEAVFAARAGAVVGPVAGEQGFHLFLVEAVEEPTLDETTAAVIRQELFDAWLKDQLKDMQIDLSWLESS
jgi:parvulin-like peptidyl-prolyl isomerase